jgi:hypothetical protein
MLNFKDDGCEVCEGILTKEMVKFLHEYTFDKQLRFNDDGSRECNLVDSGPMPHGEYSDPVMTTVSLLIQQKIEEITGLELFPTYDRYRTYYPGNSLSHHVDRPACEISVTLLLDAQYKGDKDYRWEIFADPEPYRNDETVDKNNLPANKGIGVKQNPGDALIYKGCEIPHWREEFIGEVGSYHTQLFCHFIDKNGPNYPKWKYDSRPGLVFTPLSKNITKNFTSNQVYSII